MDISESYTLHAPCEQVWDTLVAPDTLRRSVPGCESLEQTGADSYAVRLNVTIDEIQGVYDGTLHLLDVRKPEMYRMVVDSAGAQGDLHSSAALRLEVKDADTTVVHCSGQARLSGSIASVDTEAADGAANKLVRQYFDQLAELLPDTSAGTTAPEAPATTATSLPFTPAEAAQPPRRRKTTSRKPKVQQTAPEAEQIAQAEQAEQTEQQDKPQTTTTAEPSHASSATPRRRSGNSGKAQRRNGKAKDAKNPEVDHVAEIADTQAMPDGQDNQPTSEAVAPPLIQSADISDSVETALMEQAPSSEQTIQAPDVAPPTLLDMSMPTVDVEAAEPTITPIRAMPSRAREQKNAPATPATTITQRRFERATIVGRSAPGGYDIERGLKVADVLGVFIAVTAVALAVLIVTLAVGSLH